MNYNVSKWYWIVGDQPSKVWSSSILDYVEFSDTDYTTWKMDGNFPTMIAVADDLVGVMQSVVDMKITQDGIIVTSPSELAATYPLTDAAQISMANIANNLSAGRPLPGGGPTFNYADADGQRHAFSKAHFLALANGAENYVYNWEEAFLAKIHGEIVDYPPNSITL